jgi:RNA polymerase sigma-70 factor (ECF subfamily)
LLPPFDHTEKDLLAQVSSGDQSAFAQLFYSYHHQLGIYIFQLTSSREMAEEIVQDVFLKIWTNREALAKVDNFRAWLFVISKNHTLNCLRKLVKERQQQQEWKQSQETELQLDEMHAEEQFQLIDQAISQLPPQQKKVFILSRYRRMKYEEIARELNLSRETVKYYLQTANATIIKFVSSRFLLFFCFYLPCFV